MSRESAYSIDEISKDLEDNDFTKKDQRLTYITLELLRRAFTIFHKNMGRSKLEVDDVKNIFDAIRDPLKVEKPDHFSGVGGERYKFGEPRNLIQLALEALAKRFPWSPTSTGPVAEVCRLAIAMSDDPPVEKISKTKENHPWIYITGKDTEGKTLQELISCCLMDDVGVAMVEYGERKQESSDIKNFTIPKGTDIVVIRFKVEATIPLAEFTGKNKSGVIWRDKKHKDDPIIYLKIVSRQLKIEISQKGVSHSYRSDELSQKKLRRYTSALQADGERDLVLDVPLSLEFGKPSVEEQEGEMIFSCNGERVIVIDKATKAVSQTVLNDIAAVPTIQLISMKSIRMLEKPEYLARVGYNAAEMIVLMLPREYDEGHPDGKGLPAIKVSTFPFSIHDGFFAFQSDSVQYEYVFHAATVRHGAHWTMVLNTRAGVYRIDDLAGAPVRIKVDAEGVFSMEDIESVVLRRVNARGFLGMLSEPGKLGI